MAVDFPSDSGQYALAADNAAHDVVGSYITLSCWFYPHVVDGNARGLMGKWNGSDNNGSSYLLYLNTDHISILVADGGSAESGHGAIVLTAKRWYHVAGIKDASTFRIYINGKLDNSPASSLSIQNSDKTFYIGVYANASVSANVRMAEVAMWDAALSPYEVYLLSRGLRAKYVRGESLRGYWPLRKGAAASSLLADESKYNVPLTTETVSTPNSCDDPPLLDDYTNQLQARPSLKLPGSIALASLLKTTYGPPHHVSRQYTGGGSQLLYVNASADLCFSGDYMTVCVWTKPGNFTSGAQIFCRADGTSTEWDFYHQTVFEARLVNAGTDTVTGTTNIANSGRWHHVCLRKNGSGANAWQILLDGKIDGSATSNRSLTSTVRNFCLGNRGQVDSAWNGNFSEFCIWDAALTNEEILRLMKGESPLNIRPSNLRGYWPLDDYVTISGVDGWMRDYSRYQNHLVDWGTPVLPAPGYPPVNGQSHDLFVPGGAAVYGVVPHIFEMS